MEPDSLREHVNRLHQELGEVHGADPSAHPSLGALMQDLKRLTAAPSAEAASATPPTSSDEALPDRLERIAVQFEADHPTLAASSRRLVDLLGKIGV